jgi:hypothetical protein
MTYSEEKEFTLRLVLSAEFPEDYEGEEDGYEWAREVPDIAAEVVRAVVAAIGGRPGWRLRAGNRGRPSTDEVTLILDRAKGGKTGDG